MVAKVSANPHADVAPRQSAELVLPSEAPVREWAALLSTTALGLYNTTKGSSPEALKGHIEKLEAAYVSRVLPKINEHGDHLISALDTSRVGRLVPAPKVVEGTVHNAVSNLSENYIKPTEKFVGASRSAVVDSVNGRILQPTGQFVSTVRGRVEETTRVVLERADEVVERVLPEDISDERQEDGEVAAAPAESQQQQQQQSSSPVALGRKLSKRLYSCANKIVAHSTARAHQIVQVDMVGFAKERFGVDNKRLTLLLDTVSEHLPTPRTTERLSAAILSTCPESAKTYVGHGLTKLAPVFDFTFVTLERVVSGVRHRVLLVVPVDVVPLAIEAPLPQPPQPQESKEELPKADDDNDEVMVVPEPEEDAEEEQEQEQEEDAEVVEPVAETPAVAPAAAAPIVADVPEVAAPPKHHKKGKKGKKATN